MKLNFFLYFEIIYNLKNMLIITKTTKQILFSKFQREYRIRDHFSIRSILHIQRDNINTKRM